MKRLIAPLLLLCLLVTVYSGNAFAQKKNGSRIKVSYFKNADQGEYLEVGLKTKIKKYFPLAHTQIQLYFLSDTNRLLLDELVTDQEGKAVFNNLTHPKIVKDTAGFMHFLVEYKGCDTIKSDVDELSVRQADLEVSFFQKDSIKKIRIDATVLNGENIKSPVKKLEIEFFIQGTFSRLKFGEEKTDEMGVAQIDFPIDMPGDTSGLLTIVAAIDGDDNYGSIVTKGTINWGIPIQTVTEKQRGLGDTDAPLWMVYTLITLLSIVWIHYIYVIFLIFKIKYTE